MPPRHDQHLRTAKAELCTNIRKTTGQPFSLRLRNRLRVCSYVQRPDERISAKCFRSCELSVRSCSIGNSVLTILFLTHLLGDRL
jgi:hypothetical protein